MSPPLAAGERQILGIRFFTGSVDQAVERASRGGLVVAPSAPNLVDLVLDAGSREALTGADLAITDSGLMVLLWRLLEGETLERVSGYRYIRRLLREPAFQRAGGVFWVMPNAAAQERNVAWLRAEGLGVTEADCYVAPMYGRGVADPALLARIVERRPEHIVIALGAGKQEKLGFYLRAGAGYRPAIHCIGAAIGFLTGDQGRIPDWADRFYLGWLVRLWGNPRLYLPRFAKAFRLVPLLIRYRGKLPPLDFPARAPQAARP